MNLKKFNLLNDIYYSRDYVSLYLKEGEEIFEFKYQEEDNIFYNISIKRPIKKIGNLNIDENYCDLETAYGYGGFYTNTNDEYFIQNAMKKYEKKCDDENIIAEFIRFHPFNDFPINNDKFLDFNIYDRDVVYVDLHNTKEERWNNYSSKTRNILRTCNKELEFRKSGNLDKFVELYEKTMDKNNATNFYYFTEEYYKGLLKNNSLELYEVVKDNKVISIAFFMFSGEFTHYHLSANDYDMRKYNANYFILDKVFEIAKNKSKDYFILGGGTTSKKADTLLKFKRKFSPYIKPFYISGKIYNKKIYEKYNKLWESHSDKNIKYFLKYRLEI